MAGEFRQLTLFPELYKVREEAADTRPPVTTMWNLWHGCAKVSTGCAHCYMYRRDLQNGGNPAEVRRTQSFNLPVRRLRGGPHRSRYKVPSGSLFYTCFSSDFFHEAADEWRPDAWEMMRIRSDCTFFMITKRPERIAACLPDDWGDGSAYAHVQIAVTCENQAMADKRLPIYLKLPLAFKAVMVEPMLERIDLSPYFEAFPGEIASVSAGGESGPEARACDFAWVQDLHDQCLRYGAGFSYHQTGARLIKDGKQYHIPRRYQHTQAAKARLDI